MEAKRIVRERKAGTARLHIMPVLSALLLPVPFMAAAAVWGADRVISFLSSDLFVLCVLLPFVCICVFAVLLRLDTD